MDSFKSAADAVWALTADGVGSEGYTKLESDFVTCFAMTSEKDLAILLSDLMGNIQVPYLNNKNYNII